MTQSQADLALSILKNAPPDARAKDMRNKLHREELHEKLRRETLAGRDVIRVSSVWVQTGYREGRRV